jgi:uncharacterized protein with ParB-like and HNH nuclease domain
MQLLVTNVLFHHPSTVLVRQWDPKRFARSLLLRSQNRNENEKQKKKNENTIHKIEKSKLKKTKTNIITRP